MAQPNANIIITKGYIVCLDCRRSTPAERLVLVPFKPLRPGRWCLPPASARDKGYILNVENSA